MAHFFKLVLFVLLLQLFFIKKIDAQFLGYQLDDGKAKTSFPFEFINNLIIVPIILNDSIPVKFILDTGVRTTLLTDETSLIKASAFNRPVTIGGLGLIREINAMVASNVSLKLPGITGRGQTLIVLKEDYLQLQSHIGLNVHGILGYDFFNAFVVQIHYGKKIITVFEKNTFVPKRRMGAHHIKIENGRPYTEASIVQMDGTIISGSFLIDSGASHSLMLEIDKDTAIMLPENNLKTIVGWGLGGEIDGAMARIKSFKWAGFAFNKVLVSFTSGLQSIVLAQSSKPRIGSIGGEILSRFTTVYDYQNNTIYLKKNFYFNRGFEYNLSGIDIIATGNNFKTFTVVHVVENGPGYNVGILPGDIIMSVNGNGAGTLVLEDINALFRSNVGVIVNLVIMRNYTFHNVKLRLKRII